MKKIYFVTLLAALFAVSAFAQPDALLRKKNANSKRTVKIERAAFSAKSVVAHAESAAEVEYITEQPAGTLIANMSKSTTRIEADYGYLFDQELSCIAVDLVETDDALYMRDPLSLGSYGFDSFYWMKGEKGEGNVINVNPQPVFKLSYTDYDDEGNKVEVVEPLYISRVKLSTYYDEEWGEELSVIEAAENPSFQYTWENGTLTLTGLAEDEMIGIVYADGWFANVAEMGTVITALNAEKVVLPEGAAAEQWQVRFTDDARNENGGLSKIVVANGEMYIGNLPGAVDGSWIKGTIDGDQVTFLSGQYLGVDPDNSSHTFFYAGNLEEVWDEDWGEYIETVVFVDKVTFTYDAANKMLKTETGLVINLGNGGLGVISVLLAPTFTYYTPSETVTLVDPVFTYYAEWTEEWPIGIASFNISRFDANGNFIDPAKMYYNVYFDEEIMKLYSDTYSNFEDGTTDIPCTYNGEEIWFNGGSHTICFYDGGFQKFGVKVFYKDGDNLVSSNLVYYEDPAGAADALIDAEIISTTYYDLSGRVVEAPSAGLYIKSSKLSDGSVKVVKTIVK